jgi:exosortase
LSAYKRTGRVSGLAEEPMTDKTQATEKQPGSAGDATLHENLFRRIRPGGTIHTCVLYSIVITQLFVFVYCWLICFEPLKRYAVLNQNALMSVYLLNIFSLFALSLFGEIRRGFSWARNIFIICVIFEIFFSLILIKEFNSIPLILRLLINQGLNYFLVYSLFTFVFLVFIILYLLGGFSRCKTGYSICAFLGIFLSLPILIRSTSNVLSIFFPLFISYQLLLIVYFLSRQVESHYLAKEYTSPGITIMRSDRYWKYAVLGILFFFLFYEELRNLFDLWSNPQESHGLLIPAFCLYFLYQDRRRLGQLQGRANYLGLPAVLNCVGWYIFWLLNGFAYPRQLILIVMLGSIVLLVGGWSILRWVWLPIVFLLFAIPIPARLHWEIAMPLRELSSLVAAAVLNGLPNIDCSHQGVLIHGVHTIMQGGQITPKDFSLNVAEACSGMRILRTFVALGVAMAYLEYRPWIHRAVLLASTIPIAVFCNMLRVLITGILHVYFSQELTRGTPHMLLGMAMLIVAFGLYGFLAWIMNRIYVEEKEQAEGILTVGQ